MISTHRVQTQDTEISERFRYVKTVVLSCTWIGMGMFTEITGPTLKDLKLRTNSSYEAITRAISGRSAGSFSGALLGGILVHKISRYCDLILAGSLTLSAVATTSIPWVTKTEVIWCLICLQGVSEAVINIAGNMMILKLWQNRSASPMHALHLGFGVGSFIVPLIVNPFLADHLDSESEKTNQVNGTNTSSSASSALNDDSAIEYAYGIVGGVSLSLSFIFYMYHFAWFRIYSNSHQAKNNNRKVSEEEESSNKPSRFTSILRKCTSMEFCYKLKVFSLLFFFFFNVVGGERIMGKFIRTYVVDKLHFSSDAGSYINTGFWISFSCGRLIGFILPRWTTIRVALLIEIVGILCSAVILNIVLILDVHPKVMFWIFIQLTALFNGPMFPTAMAWAGYHLEITSFGIMTIVIGGGIGGMTHLWVIGYLYDNVKHNCFQYQILFFSIVVFIIGIGLHFTGSTYKDRFTANKHNITSDTNLSLEPQQDTHSCQGDEDDRNEKNDIFSVAAVSQEKVDNQSLQSTRL